MDQSSADPGVKPLVSSASVSASREDPDAALITRVQKGEIAAFTLIVNKYRERLFSIIYNLTSNREDAADLTQEAFIKAFSSIPRFRNKSNFYTWLYRSGNAIDKPLQRNLLHPVAQDGHRLTKEESPEQRMLECAKSVRYGQTQRLNGRSSLQE